MSRHPRRGLPSLFGALRLTIVVAVLAAIDMVMVAVIVPPSITALQVLGLSAAVIGGGLFVAAPAGTARRHLIHAAVNLGRTGIGLTPKVMTLLPSVRAPRNWESPWGFDPAQISLPALLLHGSQDRAMPFSHDFSHQGQFWDEADGKYPPSGLYRQDGRQILPAASELLPAGSGSSWSGT